jgi:hypothetical protein
VDWLEFIQREHANTGVPSKRASKNSVNTVRPNSTVTIKSVGTRRMKWPTRGATSTSYRSARNIAGMSYASTTGCMTQQEFDRRYGK